MQIMQTSENSSQPNIVRRIFRRAPSIQQPNAELVAPSAIYLTDGNSLQRFEFGTNCQALAPVNTLLRVSYYEEGRKKVIYRYDLPELCELVDFYGFELIEIKREDYSTWSTPLNGISSDELAGLMGFFRKLWANNMLSDCYSGDFCILEPSAIVDYENIIYSVYGLSLLDPLDKQRMLIGAYLFCIYKSYYYILRDGIASMTEHRAIIGEIEMLLAKLEHRNNNLACALREYCHVASLSESHDITEFSVGTQLVWDLYRHFQPALDKKAERVRLAQEHVVW
jgi:hypothetical protein